MRNGRHHKVGVQQGPHALPVQNRPDVTAIPFAERLTCTIVEACEARGLGRTKHQELIGAGYLDTTTIGQRRLELISSLLSQIGSLHQSAKEG